jgi:diguanylate cyclase (GGDEF)-like protein/PAS domain S-box-containing protein
MGEALDLKTTMRIDLLENADVSVNLRECSSAPGTGQDIPSSDKQDKSVAPHHKLFHALYDAIVVTDLDGHVLDGNLRAMSFFQYNRDELLQCSIMDIVAGADASLLASLLENLEKERYTLIEAFCFRKDETLFPAEIAVNKLELDEVCLCFFIRNITVRKQTVRLLRTVHNAIDNAGSGIGISDENGVLSYVNESTMRTWGFRSVEDLIGRNVQELFAQPGLCDDLLKSVIQNRQTWRGDLLGIREDKSEVSIQLSAACNTDADDELTGVVFSFEDISDRVRAQTALVEAKRRKEALLRAAHKLAISENEDDLQATICETAHDMLHHYTCILLMQDDGALKVKATSFGPGHSDDAESHVDYARAARALTEQSTRVAEVKREPCLSGDGAAGNREMSITSLFAPWGDLGVLQIVADRDGGFAEEDRGLIEMLLGHALESIKRVRLQATLKDQALHDPLTGVYNRRYFMEIITKELARSKRHTEPMGVLLMDVNGFKQINDTLGHPVGDTVLKGIASVLEARMRSVDTIIRFGGDEFLVVLPNVAEDSIEMLKERVQFSLREWGEANTNIPFPVSVAMGFACWHAQHDESIDMLLAEADKVMYEDKATFYKSHKQFRGEAR